MSRLEAGKSGPSRLSLEDLARALGVDRDWLATGEGEMRLAPASARAPSLYKEEPRSWEAALKPYLAETPLAESLPVAALSVDTDWDRVWREMPEPAKEEIRRTLRKLGQGAALILGGLSQESAELMKDEFMDLLNRYIAKVFRPYAKGH